MNVNMYVDNHRVKPQCRLTDKSVDIKKKTHKRPSHK